MSKFDKEIIETVDKLESITDEIIGLWAKQEFDEGFPSKLDKLYASRKPLINNIEEYISNDDNRKTILDNKEKWKSMMDNIKEKDEKAMELLKNNVQSLETELKQRHKQKSVLKYKENEK